MSMKLQTKIFELIITWAVIYDIYSPSSESFMGSMLTIALIVAPGKYDFRERRTVIESQLSSKLINKK